MTLTDLLADGQLDVALIPVIEYFRAGCYSIVPNIAIASRGPVLSVTLFSRVPWSSIRRVALDAGSRTSAALTQILLGRRHGVSPEVVALPLDGEAEDADADAVLLIGDRAMRACLPGFAFAFDLGQEWFDWTGLPFVYAVWAVRPGADLGRVTWALAEAKRRGLARTGLIDSAEVRLPMVEVSAELAALLAQGGVTSVQLTRSYIARSKQLSRLNAYVTLDEDGALAQAAAADEQRKAGG